MTKIVLITEFTPTKENFRGPSALPYYLIKCKPHNIDIKIFTFNVNKVDNDAIYEVAKELDVKISLIKKTYFEKVKYGLMKRIARWMPMPVAHYRKLGKQYLNTIKSHHPDFIWCYYHLYLSGIVSQFNTYNIMLTGPDSLSLFRYRKIGDINYFKNKNEYNIFCKRIRLEKFYSTRSNVMLHLVGEDDVRFTRQHYPSTNVFYLPHPHYNYIKKTFYFSNEKMRVLIAGSYDYYVKTDFDRLYHLLLQNRIYNDVSLTFIGKDWNRFVGPLQKQGYEVHFTEWVDCYYSELANHDIQIFPIGIGAGTKGKVLDALCCGLICVGSKCAFENIAVKHGESCLQYDVMDSEIISLLMKIKHEKEAFIQLAKEGQNSVLEYHSPELISRLFFEKFMDFPFQKHIDNKA